MFVFTEMNTRTIYKKPIKVIFCVKRNGVRPLKIYLLNTVLICHMNEYIIYKILKNK